MQTFHHILPIRASVNPRYTKHHLIFSAGNVNRCIYFLNNAICNTDQNKVFRIQILIDTTVFNIRNCVNKCCVHNRHHVSKQITHRYWHVATPWTLLRVYYLAFLCRNDVMWYRVHMNRKFRDDKTFYLSVMSVSVFLIFFIAEKWQMSSKGDIFHFKD